MFHFKTLKRLFIILFFLTSLGCKKQPLENIPPTVDRTVLIYIAANNSLREDAISSINKIERGAAKMNGNLIVFLKTSSSRSVLLKVKYDNSDKIASDTIKVYGPENSSDPGFLSQVVNDSRILSPAKSYGLVMWSHATSWSPPSFKTKSLGNDANYEMDIKDFKNAIPSDFEYILFDACSMGSIEVVYELKGKAKYLLTSPSEVLSSSFPYDIITPDLFGDVDALKNICRQFITYYASQTGASASATVSLIKTDQMDLLIQHTKSLLDTTTPTNLPNLSILQRLDFESTSRIAAYDFMSFLRNNFDPGKYLLIEQQLKKTVLFQAHTESFFNKPIKEFCGLSVYLQTKDDYFTDYYRSLGWYKASGWQHLF